MVPACPNFICLSYTRAIPKGLTFGLCWYVLRLYSVQNLRTHLLYRPLVFPLSFSFFHVRAWTAGILLFVFLASTVSANDCELWINCLDQDYAPFKFLNYWSPWYDLRGWLGVKTLSWMSLLKSAVEKLPPSQRSSLESLLPRKDRDWKSSDIQLSGYSFSCFRFVCSFVALLKATYAEISTFIVLSCRH